MTDQMTLPDGEQPRPWAPAYWVAQWLVISLAIAWLAPFVVLAGVIALASAFGLSSADTRESVVALATLDPGSWLSVGGAWQAYAWFCYCLVIGWRVLHATPVRRWLDRLSARVAQAWERAFEPVTRRLNRFTRSLAVVVVALGVGFLVFVVIGGSARPQIAAQSIALPSKPIPVTSAALTLTSGEIRSGQATIEQREEGVFVVVFKSDATK
jgi:hypothetical protein